MATHQSPPLTEILERLTVLEKAELHLHLRGAMPHRYFREQIRKHPPVTALQSAPARLTTWMRRHPGVRRVWDADDPADEVDALFRHSSFDDFLAAYAFTGFFIRNSEDFRGLVLAVSRSLREQGVTYAEITVSLPEYVRVGIPLEELLAVLGQELAGPPKIRWIVDCVRNFGPDNAERTVEDLLHLRPPSVVGLTLGGAEHLYPPAPFRRVYEMAREGGLRTTVHAGEMAGPSSVWEALRVLKVERIGHGIRAVEDPDLVRYLAERRIPLEICPTSNVRTGIYASIEDHPVRSLFEAGVPFSISTDDPTFFGVTLNEELAGLHRLGFAWPEIEGLAKGAFRFAFDPEVAGA